MNREEAIRRIVVERDELLALLTRIVRETVCLQAPSNATNNEPYLDLYDALGMLPTPTPLPE